VLFPDKATDHSLRFYWEFIEPLEYEIAYSERLIDYSGNGIPVPWNVIEPQIELPENREERDGKLYVYFTLEGLFPETEYYIWIKARNPNTGMESPSWSNPITMRTLEIQPPPAPVLVPANPYFINEYNKQNDTNYAPMEENALNIMWQIVGGDNPPLATAGAATNGSADNLLMDEITNALVHIVRFSGLVSNREYYIRGKTVLTVTRSGPTNIERTYAYVIEVSLDEDYTDAIVYSIPALIDISGMNPAHVRRRESEWYEVRFSTIRSADDMDGDVNPEHYPMPDRDWDLTYDPRTETLKYRFRSNLMGSDNRVDQQADHRFISRLQAHRTMVFRIDLSHYMSRPVSTREVEMPYSILRAFDERKITLEIKTDEYTFTVPPGAFDTAGVRALQPGVGANANIIIGPAPNNLPLLPEGQIFSAEPQRMTVRVGTEERNTRLETFNRPMTVAVSSEGRITPAGVNAGLYMNTPNVGGWQNIGGAYNAAARNISASLPRTGTVGAVTKTTPDVLTAMDASFDAMQRVTNIVSITDMPSYNGAERVTANRFNNIVSAIANNRGTVAMDSAPSAADIQSLTRARLHVTDDVTREAAISALVNLYELKTKRVVRPMSAAADVDGIEDAAQALRTNMLKAADIGFVDGALRPNDGLSMAEFMVMLDIILQDAGM
jgi:hypothetical protein